MLTYEDVRYAPYLRHVWTMFKQIRQCKFKALFKRVYDPKYRRDISHMWKVTGERKLATWRTTLPIESIYPSHDITYPKWVEKLICDILWADTFGQRGLPFKPIKVIWDRFNERYMVVDGNHRLAAMKAECHSGFAVPVILLYPKDTYRYVVKAVYDEEKSDSKDSVTIQIPRSKRD